MIKQFDEFREIVVESKINMTHLGLYVLGDSAKLVC